MTLLERDRENFEEGREEGREEARIEIAKNMKAFGIDIDTIIKATKLSRDEVLNI